MIVANNDVEQALRLASNMPNLHQPEALSSDVELQECMACFRNK